GLESPAMIDKGYVVDVRPVRSALEALPMGLRLQVEVKLSQIAQFANLTPPPSPMFLRLEGIDPEAVFRFEVGGIRVNFDVDVDAGAGRVAAPGVGADAVAPARPGRLAAHADAFVARGVALAHAALAPAVGRAGGAVL